MTGADDVRAACRSLSPLDARLEPWQRALCASPTLLADLLDRHGSPVNVIDPGPMGRNAAELTDAAAAARVPLTVHFARKANKALALVDRARDLGLGVDVASLRELEQTLAAGVPPSSIVVTAAVKPRPLVELSLRAGATLVIDNPDELHQAAALAGDLGLEGPVALRLCPDLGEGGPVSRFGLGGDEAAVLAGAGWPGRFRIAGVHFHLDGYRSGDRVAALGQALALIDALRALGHRPSFVDIGGGIPMSYIDDEGQWRAFWEAHRDALLGRRPPLTFGGHGLGLATHRGEVVGTPAVYPFHQTPVRGAWLAEVLAAPLAEGGTAADGLRARDLVLRCEPGRSILDGCGLTAARVAFRKRAPDGTWFVGVEMNHTQCRTSSDDFLVDPLLVRVGSDPTPPIEGYLAGAYCTERELLTWRRLRFPQGVATGDVVVFPNTAGYLMHFLESASHQIPLAVNVVVSGARDPAPDRLG